MKAEPTYNLIIIFNVFGGPRSHGNIFFNYKADSMIKSHTIIFS